MGEDPNPEPGHLQQGDASDPEAASDGSADEFDGGSDVPDVPAVPSGTTDPEVDAVLHDLAQLDAGSPPAELLRALSDAHDRLLARLSAAQS